MAEKFIFDKVFANSVSLRVVRAEFLWVDEIGANAGLGLGQQKLHHRRGGRAKPTNMGTTGIAACRITVKYHISRGGCLMDYYILYADRKCKFHLSRYTTGSSHVSMFLVCSF
jgi:hypothetical protein